MVNRIIGHECDATCDKVYAHMRVHNVLARKYFNLLAGVTIPATTNYHLHIMNCIKNAFLSSDEVPCMSFYEQLSTDDVGQICENVKKLVKFPQTDNAVPAYQIGRGALRCVGAACRALRESLK